MYPLLFKYIDWTAIHIEKTMWKWYSAPCRAANRYTYNSFNIRSATHQPASPSDSDSDHSKASTAYFRRRHTATQTLVP